jgi:hypothetical protein
VETNKEDGAHIVPAEAINRRRIKVGAGGPLTIPREDLGLDGSRDLDFSADQLAPIRRPGRVEWFALDPSLALETRLLPRVTGPAGIDKEWYYVDHSIRKPIREDVRDVLVQPFYSISYRDLGLWIVPINEGNPWYESAASLFRQEPKFYGENVFRVISDRASGKYRCKFKPAPVTTLFRWPDRPTEEILGAALGEDRIITDTSHPVYKELIEGQDLVA